MFRGKITDRDKRVLHEELQSLCRDVLIHSLDLSPHLRRDIGLDCGCLDISIR